MPTVAVRCEQRPPRSCWPISVSPNRTAARIPPMTILSRKADCDLDQSTADKANLPSLISNLDCLRIVDTFRNTSTSLALLQARLIKIGVCKDLRQRINQICSERHGDARDWEVIYAVEIE